MSKACDSQESLGVERRVDPALGGVGVRAHRVDLGDDPDRDALLGGGEGGALAGEAGSDHEDVVVEASRQRDPIDRRREPADRWRQRVAQRPADLVGGDHAAQAPLGVDRDQAAEPAQGLVAEQRLERRVVADPQRAAGVELEHLADAAASRGSAPARASAASRTSSPRKRSPASTTGNQGQR